MIVELILTVLVKVTILLLCAWLATAVLRRCSAALRHLVWAASLVAALAIPALEFGPGLAMLPAFGSPGSGSGVTATASPALAIPDSIANPVVPTTATQPIVTGPTGERISEPTGSIPDAAVATPAFARGRSISWPIPNPSTARCSRPL